MTLVEPMGGGDDLVGIDDGFVATVNNGLLNQFHGVFGQQLQDTNVLSGSGHRAVTYLERSSQLLEAGRQRPAIKHRGMIQGRRSATENGQIMTGFDDPLISRVTASVRGDHAIGRDHIDPIDTGRNDIGGLIGESRGSIILSYSTGTVAGGGPVGGLVGKSYASITSCYSIARVSGSPWGDGDGGLVGSNRDGSVISCFWDMDASGRRRSARGTGLTTAEMLHISVYLKAGWDFVDEISNGTCDYWQMSLGDYPRLRYQTGESPVMPEGLGTAEQPYLIRDARDLGTVWFEPLAHYRLEESLDLSGITWCMAVVPWFAGTFDGNGCTIRNLHIEGGGYLGFFSRLVSRAEVLNLGLEAVDITGTGDSVGGLVGFNRNASIATSCTSGSVSGHQSVGGLVGYSSGDEGRVSSSYSTVTVVGDRNVGGLVGLPGGSISMSYSVGAVAGDVVVGGLVGLVSTKIERSITASFWDAETSGQSKSRGGTRKTTAEMQTASTFLEAGWDFIDETENGTDDIWWILEGQDYPRLWWELIPEN